MRAQGGVSLASDPIIQRGFLSPAECAELVSVAQSLEATGAGVWQGRLHYLRAMHEASPYAAAIMRDAASRAIGTLVMRYELLCPLYADTVHICRWDAGMSMGIHADRTPELSHRDFSSVVFLSAEFTGGELYFPRLELTIKPEVGMLAAFSADAVHEHGVTLVKSGVRWTMPAFYTHDESKREREP